MGRDDDLERDSPDRQTDRDELRERGSHRQMRLQGHREPPPTPRQLTQVRCPHPTSTSLMDLGWHEAKIAKSSRVYYQGVPLRSSSNQGPFFTRAISVGNAALALGPSRAKVLGTS